MSIKNLSWILAIVTFIMGTYNVIIGLQFWAVVMYGLSIAWYINAKRFRND